jgi:hypothetical protein
MAHIYNGIKITALVSFLFFLSFSARTQSASFSLDDITACPVADVTLSLHVEDLFNVGAITLYIEYDTAVLEYDGHGNVHPQFPGMISNPVTVPTTQVVIAWSSTNPGNISSSALLDLYFIYKGGTSALAFGENCDITSVNLLPIPFTTEDGSVSIQPAITENPENAVVSAGVNASFSVAAIGAQTYQWQENDGSGWEDLENNATYQNVDGPVLTIVATPLALDGYWYRCFLTDGGNCEATSDSAMLTVLPELTALLAIASTGSCPEEEVAIPVQGFALDDVIEFGFFISYLPSVASFTALANVHPLIDGATASLHSNPVPHIQISWAATNGISIPDGVLFELVFDYNQGVTPLIFMEETFVLNQDQFSYNLSTINGQITAYAVPVIIAQPGDVTIYAGADAIFTVQAGEAVNYQWYESQDEGASWDVIQNIEPYSGTQSPELGITSVPVEFDGFLYKCLVLSTHCEVYSESALLTVDTVSSLNDPIQASGRNLSVAGFQISGTTLNLTMITPLAGSLDIRLYDLTGKLIHLSRHSLANPGKNNITIDLANHNASVILMQGILQGVNGDIYITTKKMIPPR